MYNNYFIRSTVYSSTGFTTGRVHYTINFSSPFLSTLYSFVANDSENLNNILKYPLSRMLSGNKVIVDLYNIPTLIV